MRAGVTGWLKQIDADVLHGEVIDRQPLLLQHQHHGAVVGPIDRAGAGAERRAITPAARSTPARRWTDAFRRTASSGSVGAKGMAEATRSTTGLATFARGSGFASTSSPDAMKTPASSGRPTVRASFTNPLYSAAAVAGNRLGDAEPQIRGSNSATWLSLLGIRT